MDEEHAEYNILLTVQRHTFDDFCLIGYLAQRKLVTYQTGYAGKSPLNLSYDNSFFKERSSAVGRGDGPV